MNSSRVVDRSERDDLAGAHAFVGGDKYHQTLAGQINERGTIKVDASKKPMTIDLMITRFS